MRRTQFIFYILVLQTGPLVYSQEKPEETVYVIQEITYLITGKTTEAALARTGEFKTGLRFTGLPELEKYIKEKIQALNNIRALEAEKSAITYTLGEAEENAVVPVYLLVSVTDSSNLVILPEPKYDSNSGFTLSLKTRAYNFLGTLHTFKIDLVWGSDDKDRRSLGFLTDLSLPFEAFGYNWTFISFNEFKYYLDGEPLYDKNVLGIAMELPVSFTTLNFGFEQGIVVHEDNSKKNHYEAGKYHSWYLYSKPYITWEIPTPLRIEQLGGGAVTYTPQVYGLINYQPGGDVGDYRRGFGAGFNHDIDLGKIDWIGNYRHGLKLTLFNDNEYNFFHHEWKNAIGINAEGHFRFTPWFGISGRLLFTRWWNDFHENAGDVIRGYTDLELDANTRLSLNLDFPFRLIRFVPSEWTGNPRYRFFDFEQHWSPFIDIVMIDTPDGSHRFKAEDIITGIGLEVITFPLKWRSFYIRVSAGWDLREWIRINRLPSGIHREIYIGLGHYY